MADKKVAENEEVKEQETVPETPAGETPVEESVEPLFVVPGDFSQAGQPAEKKLEEETPAEEPVTEPEEELEEEEPIKDREKYIPRERFDEVLRERDEARQRSMPFTQIPQVDVYENIATKLVDAEGVPLFTPAQLKAMDEMAGTRARQAVETERQRFIPQATRDVEEKLSKFQDYKDLKPEMDDYLKSRGYSSNEKADLQLMTDIYYLTKGKQAEKSAEKIRRGATDIGVKKGAETERQKREAALTAPSSIKPTQKEDVYDPLALIRAEVAERENKRFSGLE